MTIPIQSISCLLPRTQCRRCGCEGCLPYAHALSAGETSVNLCTPGGETVMKDLADLLGKPYLTPAKTQIKAVALIDESTYIGCTVCIRACPADAIVGASKLMHTAISDECTGYGLCVAPCPVDYIDMVPIPQLFLLSARRFNTSAEPRFAAAEHVQSHFEHHTAREQHDDTERKALLTQREAAVKARQTAQAQARMATPSAAFNLMDLIVRAMAKTRSQQDKLVASDNREDFKTRQIGETKERARLRRIQRDAKCGDEAEKAAAIEFLRHHKAERGAAKEVR